MVVWCGVDDALVNYGVFLWSSHCWSDVEEGVKTRFWTEMKWSRWSSVQQPSDLGEFSGPSSILFATFFGTPCKLHWRRGRFWEASRWGRMLGWPSGLWSWGSSVWSICTLIGQAGHGCQDEAESGYLQRQSSSGF